MAQPSAITLLASTAETADGAGAEVALTDGRTALDLKVQVSAFTVETPGVGEDPFADADLVVRVLVDTRASSSAPWVEVSHVDVGAVGVHPLAAGNLGAEVRIRWVFAAHATGITLAVDGEEHVIYCEPSEVTQLAVPEHSIAEVGASSRASACIVATDIADGYIAAACTMPLVKWDTALRTWVAKLAAAHIFSHRGADATQGADATVFIERDSALKSLDKVANGRCCPPGWEDSTPEVHEGGSVVMSAPARGWR